MSVVLVATIGTRDLMVQVESGEWFNAGDDQMRDSEIIGEQAEVTSYLGMASATYRELTQQLLEQWDLYGDRIRPVIIGKMLNEKAKEISQIYLIGTNQKEGVRERNKDTIFSCQLIRRWFHGHHSPIQVEILELGPEGTNPSNFEEMFRWWQQIWRERIQVERDQQVWACLKGGVGQSSEACRISGLSRFGPRIQFFEFQQNKRGNRAGIPSDFWGPFPGAAYLWDRTQQQALQLLEHYDYQALLDLLDPYFQQDHAGFGPAPNLIKAGVAWSQGNFEQIFKLGKGALSGTEVERDQQWWWKGYEQAYLGVVRLEQGYTTEAMLHSYRAVEGTVTLWALETFPKDATDPGAGYPKLNRSIGSHYQHLKKYFLNAGNEIDLRGEVLEDLFALACPVAGNGADFKVFWKQARITRNQLSHRLGGLTEKELWAAWCSPGMKDVKSVEDWHKRVLSCLNALSNQRFRSLQKASLMPVIDHRIRTILSDYQP